jgi:hypothetical protein
VGGFLYSLIGIAIMKRTLLVLAVVLVVAGFVRGWIALSGPNRQPATNKVDVQLTVDPEKVKSDANRVEEQAVELKDKVREEFRKE